MLRHPYEAIVVMNSNESRAYFARVKEYLQAPPRARILVITHVLQDRPHFLEALDGFIPIARIIPIPYSVCAVTCDSIRLRYAVHELTLEQLCNTELLRNLCGELMDEHEDPLVILEIGGYCAAVCNDLHDKYGSKLLGVIEDTEAGHRRYESIPRLAVPVVSVARSPLKLVEDRAIAQSIIASLEQLLLPLHMHVQKSTITVLGYGKLGSHIALQARNCGANVLVYDIKASRRALAFSDGFQTPSRSFCLAQAQIIIGATGTASICREDIPVLADGVVLASASSRSDEFALADLLARAPARNNLGSDIRSLPVDNVRRIHLLRDGTPINLRDDLVAIAPLRLVQAELLAAIQTLYAHRSLPGLYSVKDNVREQLAELWLEHAGAEAQVNSSRPQNVH